MRIEKIELLLKMIFDKFAGNEMNAGLDTEYQFEAVKIASE
jgi:hypothetical protein